MKSIKFTAPIDELPIIVRCSGILLIDVKKTNDEFCTIELTSTKEEDDLIFYELMNAVAFISESIGSSKITFIW